MLEPDEAEVVDAGASFSTGKGVLDGRGVGFDNSETIAAVGVVSSELSPVIASKALGENLKYNPIPKERTNIATKINKYLLEDFMI